MSKPRRDVTIQTLDGQRASVEALFDTGSFYTLIREQALPAGAPVIRYRQERVWRTADEQGQLRVVAETGILVEIGDRQIDVRARVSPNLTEPLVIGAEAMQSWDISVKNENGHTTVTVGRDARDPDTTTVI